jgi:hypothetical protein
VVRSIAFYSCPGGAPRRTFRRPNKRNGPLPCGSLSQPIGKVELLEPTRRDLESSGLVALCKSEHRNIPPYIRSIQRAQ